MLPRLPHFPTQVVLSDPSEPGEGQHKIMRFMRHLRTLPDYDPNTRHVIYGQVGLAHRSISLVVMAVVVLVRHLVISS